MSVSDPNNVYFINCTVIEMYTKSSFLKLTMSTQGIFGLLSLISMTLTLKKIVTTAMIDRSFKVIFLSIHFFSERCNAYISARLCYTLRMITAANSVLPLLSVALTIFRFCVLRNVGSTWSECLWLFRGMQVFAIAIGIAFQVYKYSSVNMDGYVVYCISNFKGTNTALAMQNAYTSACETFSILFGIYLFRSYKMSDRTFNVNCSLMRRQAIRTFHLFISYSIFQLVAFVLLAGFTTGYRLLFNDLPEPQYSAGNGFLYTPMYFSTFAPWMIYGIIRREEQKRKQESLNLTSQGNEGTDTYFRLMRDQWDRAIDDNVRNKEPSASGRQLLAPIRIASTTRISQW